MRDDSLKNGKQAIKVGLVGPFPLQRDKIRGGVEAVFAALVQGLTALPGVDVHVVTAVSDQSPAVTPHGLTLTVVPQSIRLRRLTFYLAERRRMAQSIRRVHPDVVHVQGQNWYAMAALATNYPTLVTIHGMHHKEMLITDGRSYLRQRLSKKLRDFFNARFEGKVLRQAQHIVVISPYVQECIQSRTMARLYPLPNPVEDAFFALEPQEVADRILFVGFVAPRKAVHRVLEAMVILRARRPNISLHIAGAVVDEGYARALYRYLRKQGLEESVHFLGHLDQQQLLREYSQCCLLVLSSREEASPLAIQQAMAAGKAVVATKVGGIPYLVKDGVSGYLVEPDDTPQLTNAIDTLLGNEELRLRLGAAGRERAIKQFRTELIAQRTLDIYREVIREAADGSHSP